MIAAVPELKEEVTPSAPVVVQESYCEDEENEVENEAEASDQSASEKPADNAKYVLIPAHAKNMDQECKVQAILFFPSNLYSSCQIHSYLINNVFWYWLILEMSDKF